MSTRTLISGALWAYFLLPLTASCSRAPLHEASTATDQSDWAVGQFGSMFETRLVIDFRRPNLYRCEVTSGQITIDGCGGPFRGDGDSQGTFREVDGALLFEPLEETPDISISLAGATGHRVEGGLEVRAGGGVHFLSKFEARDSELGVRWP